MEGLTFSCVSTEVHKSIYININYILNVNMYIICTYLCPHIETHIQMNSPQIVSVWEVQHKSNPLRGILLPK